MRITLHVMTAGHRLYRNNVNRGYPNRRGDCKLVILGYKFELPSQQQAIRIPR